MSKIGISTADGHKKKTTTTNSNFNPNQKWWLHHSTLHCNLAKATILGNDKRKKVTFFCVVCVENLKTRRFVWNQNIGLVTRLSNIRHIQLNFTSQQWIEIEIEHWTVFRYIQSASFWFRLLFVVYSILFMLRLFLTKKWQHPPINNKLNWTVEIALFSFSVGHKHFITTSLIRYRFRMKVICPLNTINLKCNLFYWPILKTLIDCICKRNNRCHFVLNAMTESVPFT